MKYLKLLAAIVAPVLAATSWENVRIGGGGGFVSGIVFHPTEKGLAYARTDIGGIYKLNSDDSWTPITDGIAASSSWHNWGIDALALDPQNANIIYAAVGMYTNSWDPSNGSIMKSTDKGATWTFTDLSFKVGGNMPGRGTGERLAVDPQNSNIVYFGARSGNGLWKSTNGGQTFSKVTSFTAVGTYVPDPSDTYGYNSDKQGLTFITFDSTSGKTSGATSRIFVGTADNVTASVYVSENAGSTWTAVANQPGTFFPHKCRLQPEEKALYLTYSDGTGPYDGTQGAVYRYDIATGAWKNITPVSGSNLYFGFGGLGVDMQEPGTLVVASLNSWWPDAQLFRSTDSGTTWKPIWAWGSSGAMDRYHTMDTTLAPWIKTNFLDVDSKWLGWMIESLEIDPHDSDHWLYGTGLTIYGGHDLTNWGTSAKVTTKSLADGIEEYAIQEVKSVPGGSELLAAVGDECGFTFAAQSNLKTAPNTAWNTPMWTTSGSVDYAGNKVANVVRTGNSAGSYNVAMSSNGGSTWYINYATDTSKYGGEVAYSADADTILWSTASNGVVRSANSATFSAVSSLPSNAVIASDKRENKYFYAGSGSTFYVSSNTASSFSSGGSLSGASAIRDIEVHPTTAGDLYVSTDVGIFHSTNYGTSFTKVSTALTNTYRISLGKSSSSTWNLYAFGSGSSGERLYGSADGGSTWTDVQGSTQTFGAIDSGRVAGSGNNANYVFVGTNGRGVFYGKVTISGSSTGGGSSTTTKVSSTSSTTTASSTTTTGPTITETASHYQQCGGVSWPGPTVCASPYTCTKQNDYYWQCL
ncbi:family 74 glycoside hydrolase [Dactylonectria macrodidyma]|uniref:Family 74 glycoside hydrolase n=1 Tax=Dactylonectria macrodidyma TaxID=307937 RepID=A0A9P9FIQ5_9HYPO|nr:family 74 glycoside hydrolase [Dactylonectria macrodidyma]